MKRYCHMCTTEHAEKHSEKKYFIICFLLKIFLCKKKSHLRRNNFNYTIIGKDRSISLWMLVTWKNHDLWLILRGVGEQIFNPFAPEYFLF